MTISLEDFAKSIIAYIPTGKINIYLDRMEEIQFKGRVSFEQFLAF